MTETAKNLAGSSTSESTNNHAKKRVPEGQTSDAEKIRAIRERNMDETLAESFPSSDPPSSIPDPGEEEDAA